MTALSTTTSPRDGDAQRSASIDQRKLDALLGRLIHDLGGAFGIGLVRIGRELGLYEALHALGPVSSQGLAAARGLSERYVREWLGYHAASGYVEYDAPTERFSLPDEQAAIFAREDSSFFMVDAFDAAAAYLENQPQVQRAFATGRGVGWSRQSGCLSCAVARFFRPGYNANIVSAWLPALEGVVEKLERGAKVADIGCGHGYSTLLMARAFPRAELWGFDFHDASIERARDHLAEHGLCNVRFEQCAAKDIPNASYDLVTAFDCLHDMGDPVGAAAHVREALAPGGAWMIVEPKAGDALEENLNPVSRLYYAASTMVCVPASLDQEVGAALGAQAGFARLREVLHAGGFGSVRLAAHNAFNLIIEARP